MKPSSLAPRPRAIAAELAFVLLFPGFFAYHTLLGLGLIRAFLAGYFAPVSLVFMIPLAALYIEELRKNDYRLEWTDFLFFAFLLYYMLIILCNFFAGRNVKIIGNNLFEISYLINVFILFKVIDFDEKKLQRILILCLAAMSATVFYFAVDGSFYLASLGTSKDPDSVATYQGFSRSYLITVVPLIAFSRAAWRRWAWYALGAATLFINSARSEFGALLFLVPVVELYYSRQKLLLIFLFVLVFAIVGLNQELFLSIIPDNRTLELLDLSQSTSANLRHYLTLQAWHTIEQSPVLGDYASYVSGYYSHNILSAWVDLGLFGFVFLLALLLFPALHMVIDAYLIRRQARHFVLALALLSITVLLQVLSHSFADMLIGAALGAYARYCAETRHA